MIFPVFELFDNQFARRFSLPPPQGCSPRTLIFHYGFRAFYVLMTALIAAAVPNFGIFISLVGASASAALAFVMPAIFHLKIRWNFLTNFQIFSRNFVYFNWCFGGLSRDCKCCKRCVVLYLYLEDFSK